MIQLKVNQLTIDVRNMAEAADLLRTAGVSGELQDEGETIAFVSATGQVTDLDGKEVDL